MIHRWLSIIVIPAALLIFGVSGASGQVPSDCQLPADTVAGIRQMMTAIDNAMFFELWTSEEIACACIDIYYNDPPDADFHDRVVLGAVALLGKTGDPRAVPVLIDAIDTHGPQALYALGNFPTVDALNALTANVRNDDFGLRENAAEGLRHMPAPSDIPDGWQEALEAAIQEVSDWLPNETDPDFRGYFNDALDNLTQLLDQAKSSATTN